MFGIVGLSSWTPHAIRPNHPPRMSATMLFFQAILLSILAEAKGNGGPIVTLNNGVKMPLVGAGCVCEIHKKKKIVRCVFVFPSLRLILCGFINGVSYEKGTWQYNSSTGNVQLNFSLASFFKLSSKIRSARN